MRGFDQLAGASELLLLGRKNHFLAALNKSLVLANTFQLDRN
jgi:hypothetical protein